MEDFLVVYESAHTDLRLLICIDEKPTQLLSDVRPESGMLPGEIKKVDYEYKRMWTANVFCSAERKLGVYTNKVNKNRTGREFAKFLASIERKYSGAYKIVLVMDNLNIHSLTSLVKMYGEEQANKIWSRFEVHYTTKHGRWLNQAEIAINMYSR